MEQLPPEMLAGLPTKWILIFTIITNAFMVLGRVFHSLVNHGGLLGIWRAVVYGSVTVTNETDETTK